MSDIIKITPNSQVFTGVIKSPDLLSHEQFHYDVGILVARAFARKVMKLRCSSLAILSTEIQKARQLHFITRAGLIQKRYDLDSRHGANRHSQNIWKNQMASCLANPRSDHIGGFWL